MKKIYIPTKEELLEMQELSRHNSGLYNGSIIYKYLLCKIVEILVIEKKLEHSAGALENAYKWIKEHPEIAISLCRMYPDEIKYSQYAQNDVDLCLELLSEEHIPDKTIFTLDNLTHFQSGAGVYSNNLVQKQVIEILAKKLAASPQYRFEYKEPNSLLDNIFSCNIETYWLDRNVLSNLAIIEPASGIKNIKALSDSNLTNSINQYSRRYGMENKVFPDYFGEEIIKNPDNRVKRLLKRLDRHKRMYQ